MMLLILVYYRLLAFLFAMNNLTPHNVSSIRILVTTLSAVGLAIATITMLLCAWIVKKRKELRGMTIIRVIFLLQLLKVLKCIFDIVGAHIHASSDAGCRVFVFFMLVLAAAPLNLSVFCMLYFQFVLIHKIPLYKRRPQAIAIACLVLYSVLPELFTLFIPPHIAGIPTYCAFSQAPSRRLFIFKWLVFYIWVTLACAVGVYSIVSVVFAIRKRSKKVRRRMCSTSTLGSQSDIETAAAIKESAQLRRLGSLTVIAKTLRSMIWFPIVPIVYLGFNTIYSIVWYRTQKESQGVFIVDRVLQFLAVPLFALTFYLNPSVRRALNQYIIDKRKTNSWSSDDTLRLGNLQSFESQSSSNCGINMPELPNPGSLERNKQSNAKISDPSDLYCNTSFHSVNLGSR